MSLGRLTRQELGWLLAEEARGAARTLRAEVSELRGPQSDEDRVSSLPGELSLNTLDDAIDVLTQLQSTPRTRRRGLLDLASILYELAPGWRVVLEPSGGTQVSGDEEEYRRMLQVMLTQSGMGSTIDAKGGAVEIRRDGAWVIVSAPLGPDTAVTSELERRWLARMALRFGGRYELHGKSQSLVLPAESDDRLELQALRAELLQAQELGQSYARELATILSEAAEPPSRASNQTSSAGSFALLNRVAAALDADAGSTRQALSELTRLDVSAPPTAFDLGTAIEAAKVTSRADLETREVRVDIEAKTSLRAKAPEAAVRVLLCWMLRHAVRATPRGGTVRIGVKDSATGIRLSVSDGGPLVAAECRFGLLQGRLDASALGRPAGLELVAAAATAEALNLGLELGERDGVTHLELQLPAEKTG